MLNNTYIHIPGVGKSLEQKIWAQGIHTWEEFLEMEDRISIPSTRKAIICEGIKKSSERLAAKDYYFFSQCLPSAEHWRTYPLFSESVAFVDIETTGLSQRRDRITVIGIYDGRESKIYVRDINLDDIVDENSVKDCNFELDYWRKIVRTASASDDDLVAAAWVDTLTRYHIPHHYAIQLIDG